ncbi:MAG: YggT family protein [Acetivibrionales bacterium]|jgi:hypothetical protein
MEESNSNNKKVVEMDERFNRSRNVVYYILSVVEVLLAFRLIFKLLGANPASPIVSFLYGITGILVAPFAGIFRTIMAGGEDVSLVLEPAAIIAAIFYALIAKGIVRLVEIIFFSGSTA